MTQLTWDLVGERRYETGVDRGVLYLHNSDGSYGGADPTVEAWNGLTTVTESPSGAESNKTYADNQVYVNLISAELFGATIEAYTYPDLFGVCDGTAFLGDDVSSGVAVYQQNRKMFGLCYRTRVGNDTDGSDHGYKLHLVYGAIAAPSEKAYATINDSPEAISFSWEISTTPVAVASLKPTALMTIDSTLVDSTDLATLEAVLYGSVGVAARLPLPDEVFTIFGVSGVTVVDLGVPANQPTYNASTHVVTLPAVTGVQWKINGVNKTPGAQPALTVGQKAAVTATPTSGHEITGDDDWTFDY